MSGSTGALLRTLFRYTTSRSRVLGFVGVAVVQLVVAALVGNSDGGARSIASLVDGFGLTITVPLCALVFGTAAIGDPIEDGTYVYLWLRPIRRWRISVAAFLVTVACVLPLAVLPTAAGAAIAGGDGDLVVGAALGSLGAALAYSAIFVLLGQLTRRGLVWGIVYLLIFEQFVARGGRGVGALSVHSWAVSIIRDVGNVRMRLGYFDAATAAVVLAAIVVVVLAFSARWQDRMSVE